MAIISKRNARIGKYPTVTGRLVSALVINGLTTLANSNATLNKPRWCLLLQFVSTQNNCNRLQAIRLLVFFYKYQLRANALDNELHWLDAVCLTNDRRFGPV